MAISDIVTLTSAISVFLGREPNGTSDNTIIGAWGSNDSNNPNYIVRLLVIEDEVAVHIDTIDTAIDWHNDWHACLTIIGYCKFHNYVCFTEAWEDIEKYTKKPS